LKEQASDTNGSTVCKSVFLKPTYITQLTEVTPPPLDDDDDNNNNNNITNTKNW